MQIPFVSFAEMNRTIRADIMEAFETFFDRSFYILGPEVEAFELAYSKQTQVTHTIGVSNGLDALHIALRTLGVGPGNEVIVPSHTYIATWLAVSYVGAIPVPVEPDAVSYNLDPYRIEAAITSRTKAIMPVHLYGQACNMPAIMTIAQKHGLFVIEDNAQAQLASFQGQITGSFGHMNATSFYPGKNLGALGDAGAVTTSDENLAAKARMLRNYGSRQKYVHEEIGYNMRLDECQAAFLRIKLQHLADWTKQRQQIAAWYGERLLGIGDLVLPAVADGATHVYHLYVVLTASREKLQAYLAERGVGTLIHYPIAPHQQDAYGALGYQDADLPLATQLAAQVLSLPIWPGMTEQMVDYITDQVRGFYGK